MKKFHVAFGCFIKTHIRINLLFCSILSLDIGPWTLDIGIIILKLFFSGEDDLTSHFNLSHVDLKVNF